MGIHYANITNNKFIISNTYYKSLINQKKIKKKHYEMIPFSREIFNKMGNYNKIIDIVNSKNYNEILIFKKIVFNGLSQRPTPTFTKIFKASFCAK